MSKPDQHSVFSAIWERSLEFGTDWGEGADTAVWLVAAPQHQRVLARYCATIGKDLANYAAYFVAVDLSNRARSFPELIALYELFLEDGKGKDGDKRTIPASPLLIKEVGSNKAVKDYVAAFRAYIHGGENGEGGAKVPTGADVNPVLKVLREKSLIALKKHGTAVTDFYTPNGNFDTNLPDGLKVKNYAAKDLPEKVQKPLKAARLTLRRAGYSADRVFGGL